MTREFSYAMHGVTTHLTSDRPDLIEPTELIFKLRALSNLTGHFLKQPVPLQTYHFRGPQ